MQDSVLEQWLAFLQTGFSPVELSELSLAHSFLSLQRRARRLSGAALSIIPAKKIFGSGLAGENSSLENCENSVLEKHSSNPLTKICHRI
jgi:hypothetical protein